LAHNAISFINSKNEEISLCNYETTKDLIELWGRTGFEAPLVTYIDEESADGHIATIGVKINARDVSINMVVVGGSEAQRDSVFHNLINKIFEYGTGSVWGKLKLSRSDGSFVYLNCIYAGGIDEIVEQYTKFHKFVLRFHASDPFFYDEDFTEFIFSDTEQHGLYLGDVYFGDIYLQGGANTAVLNINNTGQVCYPVITIVGPAKTISLYNVTTGKTLAMDSAFELADEEVLTIDCRDRLRSIILAQYGQGDEDITSSMALGSTLVFPINPGLNVIEITYTDTTANTSVNFAFQKRYLSA